MLLPFMVGDELLAIGDMEFDVRQKLEETAKELQKQQRLEEKSWDKIMNREFSIKAPIEIYEMEMLKWRSARKKINNLQKIYEILLKQV